MSGSKEKLDALLGIASDKSIDDVLSDLDKESSEAMEEIGKSVMESAGKIDSDMEKLKSGVVPQDEKDEIKRNIQKNLDNIDEMVSLSKNIIKHLYTNIVSTDLIDPEIIASAASFIESTRANISEYLSIYRDRQKFLEKLQLEDLQHKHRMELLERKYELEKQKSQPQGLEAVPENLQTFDHTQLIRMLNDVEKEKP